VPSPTNDAVVDLRTQASAFSEGMEEGIFNWFSSYISPHIRKILLALFASQPGGWEIAQVVI